MMLMPAMLAATRCRFTPAMLPMLLRACRYACYADTLFDATTPMLLSLPAALADYAMLILRHAARRLPYAMLITLRATTRCGMMLSPATLRRHYDASCCLLR